MWPKSTRLLWEWRGVLVTSPLVAMIVILLRLTGWLQAWEWAAFDEYMRLRPPEPPEKRIVIVGMEEQDIREIGQAIIPDGIYAKLINKLQAMKPIAIGLDVYRDLPVEPGHQELVAVFKSTPNLVGIEKLVGDSNRDTVAPPPDLKRIGSNDLIFDADKTIRRGLISLQTKQKTLPSFGMYVALLYLEHQGIRLKIAEGTKWWQIGDVVLKPFAANDGGYIRADAGGNQMLLNYRGPARSFETVPIRKILADQVSPDWGRDKIILIGAVAESSNDLFFTPYSRSAGTRMPGVEIHANIASQILSAVLDGRLLIRTASEPMEWLWILLWSTIGAALTWQLRYAGGVKSFSVERLFGLSLAAGILLGSTYLTFLAGWWIPVVPPGLALAGAVFAITAYIARTAGDIRKTFGRYLTDQVVANLLEHPEGLKMGGERRKITIFTSDLRGFTSLSEHLSPEEVVKILNFYLGKMADAITQYQGTIDEFMGDGILVLFGAPTSRDDDAQRAVACGIAMQLAMREVNQKMQEWGLPQLEMGIGINTGEVVVGNIGSEKRTKYGIVGSQVNLTYRIESYTIGGQIIISESTFKEAGEIVKIEGQRQVTPKGVKEPITIYEVGGIGGAYNLFLTQEEDEFLPLPETFTIQYNVLEGKDVGVDHVTASLIKLSAKGAEIQSTEKPVGLTNIKFNIINYIPGEISEDIYAKVLEKASDNGSFYIRFTSKPPVMAAWLDTLYQKANQLQEKSQGENSKFPLPNSTTH